MKHVAILYVGNPCCENSLSAVIGKGSTEEEAIENCLSAVRKHIEMSREVADGIKLPPKVAAMVPTALPEGSGLLILECCSHSDGSAYNWRFFAIQYGTLRLSRYFDGEESTQGGNEYVISEKPIMHSFLDCNADYEFPLPSGSMEFVNEAWVSCSAAQYGY
jgi:hypothetical protein